MSSSLEASLNATTTQPAAPDGRVYKITPEGKRTTIVLLIGVISIGVFAIWTIVTLFDGGLSGAEWVTAALMLALALLAPLVGWNLLEERAATISTDERGLTFRSLGGVELAYPWAQVRGLRSPAARKSRLANFLFDDEAPGGATTLDSTPASGANEASTNNNNIIVVPASSEIEENATEVAAANGGIVRQLADDEDEVVSDDDRETLEIVVADPGLERIANPLARALHRQAHGNFVPIYPGVEDRAVLLAEIARRSSAT